jgi:hypothetical protein
MGMSKRAVALVLVLASAGGDLGSAQQVAPDPIPPVAYGVLRISALRCGKSKQLNYVASGFAYRVRQETGILTALHAVVGCDSIRARGVDLFVSDLSIALVDIDRDVAWLRAPGASSKAFDAIVLEPARSSSGDLRVVGFPQGVPIPLVHPVPLQTQRRVKLENLLPPGDPGSQAIIKRQSPSTSQTVLSLLGALQPGHSGAAIVDSGDRVVGIGDGGLKQGTVQIGWGFDLAAIELIELTAVGARLQALALDSASIAGFGMEDSSVASDDRQDLDRFLTSNIAAARRASRPPQCRTDMECAMATRYAANLASSRTEIQHLIVEITDQFSAARWIDTSIGTRPIDEPLLNFYKQRVAEAWELFERLRKLAAFDGNVSLSLLALQARFFDLLYVNAANRPSGGCAIVGFSTPGFCVPLDRGVREASRKGLRESLEAVCIRLGVDP